MEVVGGVAKELAKILFVGKIEEWCSYITTYDDNMIQLEEKYEELDKHKEKIISKADRENENLQKRTEDFNSWLEKVTKLMEDNENLKQLRDKESREDQCCFAFLHCNLCQRYEMSKTAENKVKEIEEVIKKAPSESKLTEARSKSELKPIPTEFLESLDSRFKLKEDVLKKLQDEQVNVVGIFGMGGVGKTTLVKEIYNKGAKDKFEKLAMVEISEIPEIKSIQDQIADQLNNRGLFDAVNSIEQRAKHLLNSLKGNETKLIILDNIWDKLDLSKVGIPQPHENEDEFCCKLLMTSRKKNVCEIMGASAANIFEVQPLDEKEATELFRVRVGEKGKNENIEKRMLKKCGGLPLSIVALADVLRGQESPMWELYAKDLEKNFSIHGTIKGVNRLTYSILETSYKHIESEEKRRFFMLACLFPLGSSISVDDMMRYGTGLGLFQHVDNLSEAIQQANTWADELISSSLLLADDHEGHVKIHDVVRASMISLAEKGGDAFMVKAFPRWMNKETRQKYSAISLTAGIDHSRLSELHSDKLQMLILDSRPRLLFDHFFSKSKLTNLKVLVLKGMTCESLSPESIESFKNSLTTLYLECCSLRNIGWIGELVSLVVLSLCGSSIDELPEAMKNLCDLRLLDLSDCKICTRAGIPTNIVARLSQLEGLYAFNAVKKCSVQECGAEEGYTSIDEDFEEDGDGTSSSDGFGEYRFASVGALNELNYLKVLEMIVRPEGLPTQGDQLVENLDRFHVFVSPYGDIDELEWWESNRILQLEDLSFSLVMENNWGKALVQKAESLSLYEIKEWNQYFVHELQQRQQERGRFEFKGIKILEMHDCHEVDECNAWPLFPNLEVIRLIGMRELMTIQIPPKLTYLHVEECSILEFIFGKVENEIEDHNPTHNLSFLREIFLWDIPKLKSMMEVSEASNSPAFFNKKLIFEALEELVLKDCGGIATVWDIPCSTEVSYVSCFNNLKVIFISSCSNLKSLGSLSIATALELLEELTIIDCGEIREGMSEDGELDEAALISNWRGDDNNTLLLFPCLRSLDLSSCPKMEWFIRTSKQNTVVEFPSLERLYIGGCDEMKSFSAESYIAPKLNNFFYKPSQGHQLRDTKRSSTQDLQNKRKT